MRWEDNLGHNIDKGLDALLNYVLIPFLWIMLSPAWLIPYLIGLAITQYKVMNGHQTEPQGLRPRPPREE